MSKEFCYSIIGSGMMGTAVGFDLARFGDASKIFMVDRLEEKATEAAQRINRLTGDEIATGVSLEVSNEKDLVSFLKSKKVNACCGAAHYALNVMLSRACLEAGSNFCDMGGNTKVVKKQHQLHAEALNKGVCIVPDCGLAPGLGNILAARALKMMDCDDVQIRCGGLPQKPKPPLGYRIVFAVEGLTNEYTGMCREIRDGKIVEVPAFTEKEDIEIPLVLDWAEAFLTSGGTSTGPDSFLGKVRNYGYKTIRYPGHYDKVKTLIDLGFLDLIPVKIGTNEVVPRELTHELFKSKLVFPDDKDLVVLRVTAQGYNSNEERTVMIQEMFDYSDDKTGFSAMERTTAFPTSVIAIMMTHEQIYPGVAYLELVIDGDVMIEELAKRNIVIKTTSERI
jgi:lysine 6-dehydrogenase